MLTEKEYRSHKAVSQSNIKDWLKMTPATYKRSLETPREASEAMKFGCALHMGILEPQEFAKHYAISDWYTFWEDYEGDDKPKTSRRAGKVYEAWKAEFEAKAEGKEILADKGVHSLEKIEEVKRFISMNTKVLHNPSNRYEVALFGDIDGSEVKGKIDILRLDEEKGAIIDLKFTDQEISTDKDIERLFWNGRWDIQAAMYIELVRQNYDMTLPFIFVVVNKKSKDIEIRKVVFRESDDSAYMGAAADIREALEEIRECEKTGIWEAERPAFEPIFRPKYINRIIYISIKQKRKNTQ